MKTWIFDLANNEISIIHMSNKLTIISEHTLNISLEDIIIFGVQVVKVVEVYKSVNQPNIDSNINFDKNVYEYEVEVL